MELTQDFQKNFGYNTRDRDCASPSLSATESSSRSFSSASRRTSQHLEELLLGLEVFEKAGEVTEVRLATKEDGSFRGFGHVEFVTEALRMNGHMFLGRRLIVDLARERGSNNLHTGMENGSYRTGAQDSGHSVYVKGFGKSLEEDQIRNLLKEHFGFYGEIIRVSIPQDNKTGCSKGFAYVLFNDKVTASESLELNGAELGGYTLTVQEPTPKSGPCDGAYGGGRGRGGRSADQG